MKTLYLHIGTPKTATTAIQNFCKDNRDILAQMGYCYPIFDFTFPGVGQYCNAHFLIINPDKYPYADKGIKSLSELFQIYDNVILSDERIWNNGFSYNCWDLLNEHILSQKIRIKVVVYLRRQDEFLFSWWNQKVKAGTRRFSTISWQALITSLPYIQLDYYTVLEKISSYVGKENVIVRIFNKERFLNQEPENTVIGDFLRAIDLDYSSQYKINKLMRNPSLSFNNLEIKRHINTLADYNKEDNTFFSNILRSLSEEHAYNHQKSMFSKEELDAFLEDYKAGNARIAQEYLGIDNLFDYSYKAKEKWEPNNKDMPADIIKLFASSTLYLLHEINKLQTQLDVQKHHLNNLQYKLHHPAKTIIQKIRKDKNA